MNASKFGIVIPCFNEEGNLERLIDECEYLTKCADFEFVLVNNGSNDNSKVILNKLNKNKIRVVNLDINGGYGGGILAGLKILESEFVGWIHADLQTDIRKSLVDIIEKEFEFFKGKRTGRNFSERLFSFGMSITCSLLFRTILYEVNAQPTIMKRSLYVQWENPPKDFSLDLYALLFAKKNKVRVERARFEFVKRTHGHSAWNFGIQSRIKMINRTLKYSFGLARNGIK